MPESAFRDALGEAASEVAKLVPELRQRFPNIPPAVELQPEQQQRYLFSNFLGFIERAARVTPLVLLIDDLHWADESTLLLLQHVAQHLPQARVLVVGTYRDVDLEVTRPFAKMLEALTRQRLARKLTLGRLPPNGVGDMLEVLSGHSPPPRVATAVYSETEGNPFFVEEVFQHLSEEGRLFDADGRWRTDLAVEDLDVPEGIRLVIGRRIERLTPDVQRVLTTAAVVGRSFDLTFLEALGDAEGDALLTALEQAEAAKLIHTVSSGREVQWEFAHGLIRQTLESSLSLPRRQRVHLRIAEAIERVHGARVDRRVTDVAHHLYQAGAAADLEKTVRFMTLAGDQALEAGAFDEALRLFEHALSVADDEKDRAVADLQSGRGRALRSLGRGPEAVEEWSNALTIYERLGASRAIARVAADATWVLAWQGQVGPAQELARRALESVGDSDDAARCRLLALLVTWLAGGGGDYRVTHDLLAEAEQFAAKAADPALMTEVLQARTWFHYGYMECAETLDVGRQAAASRTQRGELYDVCEVSFMLVMTSVLTGRLRDAVKLGEELGALSSRVGHASAHWCSRFGLTYHHLVATGDLAASEARARGDVEEAERLAIGWRGFSYVTLGLGHFFAGDWPAARSAFDTAAQVVPQQTNWVGMFPSFILLLQAHTGREDVSSVLHEHRSELLSGAEGRPWGLWEQLVNVVEGLATLGQSGAAADLYPLVLKGLEKGVIISWQLRLWQMVAGIAASCGGQWDAAQDHFETALRQAHELPHKIAQPEVRRWYARMLLDRDEAGDREKARVLLGEATEMYRTIGMPKHVEMAEKLSAHL